MESTPSEGPRAIIVLPTEAAPEPSRPASPVPSRPVSPFLEFNETSVDDQIEQLRRAMILQEEAAKSGEAVQKTEAVEQAIAGAEEAVAEAVHDAAVSQAVDAIAQQKPDDPNPITSIAVTTPEVADLPPSSSQAVRDAVEKAVSAAMGPAEPEPVVQIGDAVIEARVAAENPNHMADEHKPTPNPDSFLSHLALYAKTIEDVCKCNQDAEDLKKTREKLDADIRDREQALSDLGAKELEFRSLRRKNEELTEDNTKLAARIADLAKSLGVAEVESERMLNENIRVKSQLAETEEALAKAKGDHATDVQSLKTINEGLVKQLQSLAKSCQTVRSYLDVYTKTTVDPEKNVARAMQETDKVLSETSQYVPARTGLAGILLGKK
jgi:septal ring factor EnvC (AmiA/AmiB activator)